MVLGVGAIGGFLAFFLCLSFCSRVPIGVVGMVPYVALGTVYLRMGSNAWVSKHNARPAYFYSEQQQQQLTTTTPKKLLPFERNHEQRRGAKRSRNAIRGGGDIILGCCRRGEPIINEAQISREK